MRADRLRIVACCQRTTARDVHRARAAVSRLRVIRCATGIACHLPDDEGPERGVDFGDRHFRIDTSGFPRA